MPPSLPNYSIKIDNTEQKNKPLPKGSGQLLRNCFFSSVSKLKKTLFSWAQKFSEFLVILEFSQNSRPKTSANKKHFQFSFKILKCFLFELTQEVFDFKQKQEIFDIHNY